MNEQPISKQDLTQPNYLVNEIFYSIQGEGPWQGYPTTFLRLSGCNLRCTWCDTEYSSYTVETINRIIDELLAKLPETNYARRVVITGGEPFRQNIAPLVHSLHSAGFQIQIETNGTLSIPAFPFHLVTLVCSPKAGKIHQDILTFCDHYKYVIGQEDITSADGLPLASTQENGKKPPNRAPTLSGMNTLWVMPRDDETSEENRQATIDSALKFGHRICLQLHKILDLE